MPSLLLGAAVSRELVSILGGALVAVVVAVLVWLAFGAWQRHVMEAWLVDTVAEILGRGWSMQLAGTRQLSWVDEVERGQLLSARRSEHPKYIDIFLSERAIPLVESEAGNFNIHLAEDAPALFYKERRARAKARAFLRVYRKTSRRQRVTRTQTG